MRRSGFTLIELMVVMAIIALLLTFVAPRYFGSVNRAEEAALKQSLWHMRDAIDKFYGDNGRYPEELAELVTGRYLRTVPADPFTARNDSWVIVAPPSGVAGRVYDVRSGAPKRASDGTEVAKW
jgi:general secretion pathway protein G